MGRAGLWWAVAVLCFGACATSESASSELGAACFSGVELGAWDETFAVYEWCGAEIDEGADGDIDGHREQVFDEAGKLIERVELTGEVATFEYDELGRSTLIERADGEGQLLWRQRITYDGRSSRTERDYDGDGAVDTIEQADYSCFPEEDAWPFPGACSMTIDDDGDGLTDRMVDATYEDGLINSELRVETDGEPRRSRYFYDEDGDLTLIEEDYGDDGTIDYAYHVDQIDAHTTLTWQDMDADGERDNWTETVTDDAGRVVRESMFSGDDLLVRNETAWSRDGLSARFTSTNEHPEQDMIREERYDSSGNVVGFAIDTYPLGSPDECRYVSYACWAE